jgi:hypothetical protein
MAGTMTDRRTDEIARLAARLIETGLGGGIDEAVRAAAERLGHRDAPLPRHGLVRRHAAALSMLMRGDEGHAQRRRRIFEIAERLMTVFVEARDDVEPLLAGRAAAGLLDAGAPLHVRLYTRADAGNLARTLVEFGYDEPAFETAETRHGRLNRLRLVDEGVEIVLTRCLPEMRRDAARDLFTGEPVATATLEDLRDRFT